MKLKYLILLLLTFTLPACKDNSIQVSGKLNQPERGEYITLSEIGAGALKKADSVQVGSDGKFSFKKDIKIPTFYVLKTTTSSFMTILMEPGEKLKVEAGFNSLNLPESVTGSAGTQKIVEYNKVLKSTIDKLRGLNEIYNQNADSKDLSKVVGTLDSTARGYLKEMNTYTKKFVDDNVTSMVSLIALYQQIAPKVYILNPRDDIRYFVKVDSTLTSLYPTSDAVKSLHEQVLTLVEQVKKEKGDEALSSAGAVAAEIELPGPTGQMIKLSSTRGKFVLLDFWASWCGPCRRENPNLVRAYNMYKDKGFQIFQVSLDKTKEEWLKGIEQDMLGQWIHVSDLKYWNSSVVKQYKIEAIPFNLLLDREGRVIASNLRGEKLQAKLAEVLK